MKITQQQLEQGKIELRGWRDADGNAASAAATEAQFSVWDYFDLDGEYKGPDVNGIEPVFIPSEEE